MFVEVEFVVEPFVNVEIAVPVAMMLPVINRPNAVVDASVAEDVAERSPKIGLRLESARAEPLK